MTHPITKLGEVAEFIRGITFKPDDVVPLDTDDAVVCMRTKNVQATLECDDLLAVPSQFVRRENQYLDEGDILVSSANSWNLVGKCCWVPALPWKAAFGGFVSVLRGDAEKVDRRYLYWWFSSGRIQSLLRSFGQKTTNISNLNIDRCLQLDLPLPPLPEQRRIAAILDKADALRAKRREALAQLDSLAQSIFVEMFGDPATNPKGWAEVNVGDVGDVQGGLQLSASRANLPLTVPYLRVANVYRDKLDLSEVKTFQATAAEYARTKLEQDDLLIVEGHGNPNEIGRCAIWNGAIAECSHQNHLIRVRINRQVAIPGFVSRFLNSGGGRKGLTNASNTTSGLNTISVGKVRACRLLLPPFSLQLAFVERLESILGMVGRQSESLQELDRLCYSLQSRAFQGAI